MGDLYSEKVMDSGTKQIFLSPVVFAANKREFIKGLHDALQESGWIPDIVCKW